MSYIRNATGLRRSMSAARPVPGSPPSWRLNTAVRIFALAFVVGQVVDRGLAGSLGIVLVGLAIVGGTCCICELQAAGRTPWLSVAEGVMVGLLIGMADVRADALHLYLAIPAVAAGLASGRLATANTWLVTALSWLTAEAAAGPAGDLAGQLTSALPWLGIGLGVALLAAQQSRSLRTLAAAQAPYAAAHRLVGQLHTLVRDFPAVLDVATQARAIREAVDGAIGGAIDGKCSVVLVRGRAGIAAASPSGPLAPTDEETGRLCALYGRRLQRPGATALPLRVGPHVIGAVVLGQSRSLTSAQLEATQQLLDEHAIRLETALLVDEVRIVATAEERNRLARDIHDGIAQRVVSLGYLADEVAATSGDPLARQAAEALRSEFTKLISELRFSVFDLRQDVDEAAGVSAALSEYVQELSTHSELRVHLTLDEREARLPRRTETELLRIAQEAIGNVHKHARAINVWVNLRTIGSDLQLVVEDDGVGGAIPRTGHYGMHTMRERAERIDADLEIGNRQDGGTIVTIRSRSRAAGTNGEQHDQRLARR
ncbi:hypothetical protein GCM10009844_31250 [Nocardioides koreensis]|uniref:Signal transduction histidine kinase subgroup 3 dimerisation and phosphoacceptor domain-containing protein n=1 Tax=Nocardioides koreensis TaxID=433651 RepID=A0ABP5LTJ2_9ACTN